MVGLQEFWKTPIGAIFQKMIIHPMFREDLYNVEGAAKNVVDFLKGVGPLLEKVGLELAEAEKKFLFSILKQIDLKNMKILELDDMFLNRFKQYIDKYAKEFSPEFLDDVIDDFGSK